MIVADASVLAPALADDGAAGDRCRDRLAGEHLVAPELVDLEVCSVLRKLQLRKDLTARRASAALTDLYDLPMHRVAHRHLLHRVWQLRGNVSPYDAAYVALAEVLGLTLVTGDERLAAAPGARCDIEVLTSP